MEEVFCVLNGAFRSALLLNYIQTSCASSFAVVRYFLSRARVPPDVSKDTH
jgi:hypothetical protein